MLQGLRLAKRNSAQTIEEYMFVKTL